MAGRIALVRTGAVAEIRIDQPDKFNAMSLQMWQDLVAQLHALHAAPQVRVLLLRGEGDKAFVSGADISEFDTRRSAESGSEAYDLAVAQAQRALIESPFPVVALVHGICYGGGLGLAMSCDLRYGALESKYRMPAARLGLGYGFDGIHRMVEVLGAARVSDLFFTARVVAGAEAQRIGLINAAWPASELDARVEEIVQQIAVNAPLTLRLAKKAIRLAQDAASAQAAAEIEEGRRVCLLSADYAEGRRAFGEKRSPVFRGE